MPYESDINQSMLLTAPGMAAIAVVRLQGPGVESFLQRHFSKPVLPGRCVHGLLSDGERVIDDAVVVRSNDWVDLNLHGGNWVVNAALQLAGNDGFEQCDLLGMDAESLLWLEVLEALPNAKTETAVRLLLAQPQAWERLPNSSQARQKILAENNARWLLETPTVAVIGPANVGKSTLANQLFGQARSITADLPGTTRDWVGEITNIDGLAVLLLDTPGQRETVDPIEHAAIAASATRIREADLIVLVFDRSQPLDHDMLAAYPSAIIVANKSDAPQKWNAGKINAIETIATTGHGLNALRSSIQSRFGFDPADVSQIRWWTDRQRDVLAHS